MSCQVKVHHGLLEGKVCKSHFGQTYYSFEGIPYAKPPVGNLRFRAPQELESWTGVWDATKPRNKCAQINPYGNMTFEGSEDCLYLNVYTPKLPAQDLDKLPVLFFVHGGRLLIGYGDYYRPDYLLRHDVILVTINYRLHILGFLCLHTPEIPGNAGLKDTIMALKWVKENIQYFNGDPDNIITMGESAGGAIVTSYLVSNMAEGLFSKMISQSGNYLSDLFMVEEDEEAKARNIVKIMGKEIVNSICLTEYLTDASLHDLLDATVVAELSRPPSIINAYFLPVVEKEFKGVQRYFTESPHVSLKNNRFKKVPILVTISSHEGAFFVPNDGNGNIVMDDNFQNFIPRYLSIKPESVRAKKFANSLQEYYFKNKPFTQEIRSEYLDFISDVYFVRDTVLFIESISKYVDTYVGIFSFNGELNTGTMKRLNLKGASHGDLLQYLFFRKNKIERCKEKERIVVDTLCEAWCNFAKTGSKRNVLSLCDITDFVHLLSPNQPSLFEAHPAETTDVAMRAIAYEFAARGASVAKPTWSGQKQDWLAYSKEKRQCLSIDNEIKLIPYPNFDRYKLWFSLMYEKSKL